MIQTHQNTVFLTLQQNQSGITKWLCSRQDQTIVAESILRYVEGEPDMR